MDAVKFTLSGNFAFFKKPDVNSYYYFTYGCIHKIALLGILGAVIGYGGYNQMSKSDIYPEFYEKLKDIKIGIEPKNNKGYINKKVQVFNNSIGYASKEQGGNLIVKEQWLEKPVWDIYILLESNEEKKLAERLINSDYIYIPYLGKNDHIANIEDVEIINNIKKIKNPKRIDSIFIKDKFKLVGSDDYSFEDEELFWKYEEKLPISLDESANKYNFESVICTNSNLEEVKDSYVYSIKNKNIFFL